MRQVKLIIKLELNHKRSLCKELLEHSVQLFSHLHNCLPAPCLASTPRLVVHNAFGRTCLRDVDVYHTFHPCNIGRCTIFYGNGSDFKDERRLSLELMFVACIRDTVQVSGWLVDGNECECWIILGLTDRLRPLIITGLVARGSLPNYDERETWRHFL